MIRFIIRRVIGLVPIFIGVVIVSFALMQAAPGGPEAAIQGQQRRITPAQMQDWLSRWCLQPEDDIGAILMEFGGWSGILNCENEGLEQFFSEQGGPNFLPAFLGGGTNGVIHGDLGTSLYTARPVADMIGERVPGTLILTITALVLWVSVAIAVGVYAAVRRYSLFDHTATFLSYVFFSLPTFWLGLMLIFLFGPLLGWLPTGGVVSARDWPAFGSPQFWGAALSRPWDAFTDIGRHLILPVVTLVAVNIAADSRFVRASMLESLSQDYVRTAKAKGLAMRTVIGKHAFRNALLPLVTNVALSLPFLFSGAVVTETIFSWPGMGRLFIEALGDRDYFVLMGILLVTSMIILLANLLADVLYAVVDPRIRYD